MRIALGGFLHESHSFAPRPTGWQDFLGPGGWPALQRPATLFDALRPTALPLAGALRVAEAEGATPVPLSWAIAEPGGPVTAEAFERIASLMLVDLHAALERGRLDGVYLDLHGAMLTPAFPDAEGELLRRLRALVGPEVAVAASLDPHANLTAAMVRHADVLSPFRTYPHVDMAEAGDRAMSLLLARIRRRKPFARAFRQLDFLIPITSQSTLDGPMAEVMAARTALGARLGAAELALCFGFPYADFADCGPAVAAFAVTEAAAAAAAEALAREIALREPDFAARVLPAAEAVAQALRLAAASPGRPVVLADTQDNPGGGGPGDTTGLLAEMLRQGAENAAFAAIHDPAGAAACHAAGPGAELALRLGGASDGAPLAATARVLRLSDGRFTCTGPVMRGTPADLGPCALVALGGVRVVVTSRRMQAHDQALLRHLGLDPAGKALLALKSSVHFRADFGPLAGAVVLAAAPGAVVADPAALPFRHLRPGLRLRPGDKRRVG